MIRRLWEYDSPRKGNIVEFTLTDGNKVVGYYWGQTKDKKAYILSDAIKSKTGVYLVEKLHISIGKTLTAD